jgi:hypothetical protein
MGDGDSNGKQPTTFLLISERSVTTKMDWEKSDFPTLAKTYSDVAKDPESTFSGELPNIEKAILQKMGEEKTGMEKLAHIAKIAGIMEIDSLPDSVYLFGMEILAEHGGAGTIFNLRMSGHLPDSLREEGEECFQSALEKCAEKGWVSTIADLFINAYGEPYYEGLCSEASPHMITAMQVCIIKGDRDEVSRLTSLSQIPEGVRRKAYRLQSPELEEQSKRSNRAIRSLGETREIRPPKPDVKRFPKNPRRGSIPPKTQLFVNLPKTGK